MRTINISKWHLKESKYVAAIVVVVAVVVVGQVFMICLAINNTKALKAQRSMVIEGDIVAVLLAAVAAPIALLVVVVVVVDK